ncbi:MAG: polysaccharide biosynthesis C-terminal domain-containing protein [Terracidiphilus sp.]|jgi:O-antigen/teichoic acid export membrane protein
MANTKTIARNTGWYGLENILNFVVGLTTSIAIARTLGPQKMWYLIYVSWLAQVISSLGGMGVPATTRKYMAEFLGRGDKGTARYIYLRTMRLQAGLAALITAGLVIWVLGDAPPEYKLAAVLIVIGVWPRMVNSISAQANVAAEELFANLPASAISICVFGLAVLATVLFHGGIIGFSISIFLMGFVDFLVRIIPTMKRITAWSTTHVQPEGLSERMFSFAWQSVITMIASLIVWDRSEFFLLKHLCPDKSQLSYYSVAFNMAERLLITSTVFGSAAGATIFAQYGRDKSKLPELTAVSLRYLALTSIPLHVIAAALAFPALLLLYGNQYRGAAMVATLAPLLCMPKAFTAPVQSLLQSMERQSYVIWATVLAGIVDVGVAWYFIPAHGAVGACFGNGAAQVAALGIMWAGAIYLCKVKLPWMQITKITFASGLASLAAYFIAARLAPLWGILLGGIASLIVLFGLIYLMRVLEPEDRDRFKILAAMLPRRIAGPVNAILMRMIPLELGSISPNDV